MKELKKGKDIRKTWNVIVNCKKCTARYRVTSIDDIRSISGGTFQQDGCYASYSSIRYVVICKNCGNKIRVKKSDIPEGDLSKIKKMW